ncbi:hypothetical protein CY658_02975 [Variovorax sp. RO1]|uniref:hypothetical protein n=1 Tax=Variovorax sp. RO1 TaxID=2066034 RepID=UPI000CBAB223|nr:hypothetical protein [Variovorax sp. RO1]PLC06028.1 hypothetical protein CY658_02975 [Variovorax sp. RO1]
MSALKSWRRVIAPLVLAGTAMLVGCTDDSLPTCTDPTAQNLLKKILVNSVARGLDLSTREPGWLEKVERATEVKLTMVRTTGTDEEYRKRSCAAQLQMIVPSGTEVSSVEYTIQQTDDKKDLLVEMRGHDYLVLSLGVMTGDAAFKRAIANMPTQKQPATTGAASPAPSTPSAPGAAAPLTPAPTATGPTRTVADATLIWLNCEDLCHLQYKTAQGELKSALCTEAPICRQWTESPPEFNKRIGSRATLTLGTQFVPEGGVTLDSLQGIEWRQ